MDDDRAAPEALLPAAWSVKEVVAEFKSDIIRHLDKQDKVLDTIDRRLDTTATQEDIRLVRDDMRTGFRDAHQRIDRVEARITPLEQQAADEKAVEQQRGRFRTTLAWMAGIAGTLAIIASVVVALVH